MADLKLGTQIGGNLVWHQGILDLNPVDTKLYFQDQEVLVDTGYQTLKGTMKFNVPANQYDIESLSTLPTNSKSMLRKFRGGNIDTVWHETVQGNTYRISTGTTDANLILQLVNGNAATFQHSVLTNAAQSTAANSFVRKDYADAIDAKNVAKAGDTMTGDLLFDSASRKVRVNEVASVAAGWDAAGNSTFFRMGPYDQAKGGDLLEIRSAGAGVGNRTSGFDVRTTKNISNTPLYVGDHMVYHPANKPTPNDLGAYNKAEIDSKSWLRVKDERAAMIQPSALDPKTMGLYFTNQSDVTSSWVSGFTVKGWDDNYAAWSLFSAARSDADDKRLWFKHGRTDWMASTRIYHEDDKPTNDELNLVSRAGDEMNGPLTIRNSTFQCVTEWDMRRVMKQLGFQGDAKPVLVLFCPRYIGAALSKRGFVGRVTFNRGSVGAYLQSNYVDISAVTAYTATDAQIHYASGGTPVKLVYVTHNGVEYLAMYRSAESMASIVIDGYCYGADPILISDATGYAITDVVTRERIYSSDNKPTNVDLNLVSRAGDTMTGSLNGPDFIQTTPQSSNGAASARKDYVDAQDAKTVAKAGDIMTGSLTAPQFNASTDYGFVRSTNTAQGMFVGADGRTIIGGGAGALILRPQGISNAASESAFNNDGTIAISKTGTADNHLVTKKYVDDKVGTAVQSVTATGAVKSTGGINPVISLANATNAADGAMSSADKAKLDGIPAAAVNRTGDTMTGQLIINAAPGVDGIQLLGTPSATGDNARGISGFLADGSKRTWGTGILTTNGVATYAYLGFGESPWDNSVRVYADKVTSATSISAPDFIQTTAQSTNVASCTRKDYVDAQVGAVDAKSVAKAGDTMTGALKWNNATTYVTGSGADLYVAANTAGGRVVIEGAATPWARVAGADYEIYHKGNRPTPVEIGAMPILQLNNEDLNTIVIAGVYEQHANVNTPGKNYPENLAGSLTVTNGAGPKQSYHVYNTSRVYTRAQYSTGGFTAWALTYNSLNKPSPADLGAVNVNQVNFVQDGTWAGVINKIPYIGGNGVMEVGKYVDFHDTNSALDYNVRLNAEASNLAITTPNGTIQIGAMNASYAHIYTDRPTFYFNKEMQVNGSLVLHDGSSSGTLTLSNWIRTTGESGLFCATFGGGIHMQDATWVRTYNNKKFYVSNTDGDAIHTAGGMNANGNGSFNDVQIRSDERLKSNYQPITSALDKVDHLAGITYDKIGKTTREAGIIAQRLKEVLPEATGVVSDSMDADAIEYLTISNSGVNALLVEAIKELTNRVKYLESKLN